MTQNLNNLFEKDIYRDIKGVVKVGQQEDSLRYQEVDEYVVTKELMRHLNTFYTDYGSSIDYPTDKNGVWISGFFGSGKSHFLKILSYLLGNRTITHPNSGETTAVVNAFKAKIKDPLFLAEMKRCAEVPTDVILFNIDSKADSDSKNDKEAIVKVFLRVFNESLGYSTKSFQVAEMERYLDGKGKLQSFKNNFQAEYGESWQDSRDDLDFLDDELIAALSKTLDMSAQAARKWHDGLEKGFGFSINELAKLIKKHLDAKGRKQRIIFMIDEVGQYVGDNRDLMLNLQTVAEDLGTECGARAWVMVTAQEAMDQILADTQSFHGKDFSKIQGRFSTRLSLSSAHADEVIQRRLLNKKTAASEALTALWATCKADLDNLYTFEGGAELKSYKTEEEFVSFYPFAPFQFKLLQRTLETIRKMGDTGRHIAQGERSLLDAAQQALKTNSDEELGILIPYYTFFQSIETFFDSRIRRVFERAEANSHLNKQAIQVLRTLFLVKYLDEFRATPDNIATLHIANVNEDKLKLKQGIRDALERLEGQFLVQHIGETWCFLTDEEQDVSREIKLVACSDRERIQVIGKTIIDDIWNQKQYRYKNEKDFRWCLSVDGSQIGSGQEEIVLELVTPLNADHRSMQTESIARTRSQGRFFWVMAEEDEFIKEARTWYQTSQYVSSKWSQDGSPNLRVILNARKQENDQRKIRLVELIKEALQASSVYVNGTLQKVRGDTTNMLNSSLAGVVESTFKKYNYAGQAVRNPKQVAEILGIGFEAENTNLFQPAEEDMLLFIQKKHRPTIYDLVKSFGQAPYGWAELNALMIVARLLHKGKLQLARGSVVSHRDTGILDAWQNRKKSQEYTISIRQSAGAEVIRKVRDWVRDFYSQIDWPSEETDFVGKLRDSLSQTQSKWKEWSGVMQANQYPAYQRLKSSLLDLEQVLNNQNDVGLMRALVQQNLDGWLDDHDQFASFLKSQRKQWDKAKQTLVAYDKLPEHLKTSDFNATSQNISTILKDPDPWRLIPKLPLYEEPLREHLKALVEKEKTEVVIKIEEALGTWRERLVLVPGGTNQALRPLEHLLARAREAEDVGQCLIMQTDLSQSVNQVRDAFNRHVESTKKQEPKPNSQPGVPPDPSPKPAARKKYKKLRLRVAVPHITKIETTQDKERFLEELSRYFDRELAQDTIVEL